MDTVRRRLDELKARARRRAPAPPASSTAVRPKSLADVLGGRVRHVAGQTFWAVETSFDRACPDHELSPDAFAHPLVVEPAGADALTLDPARALVLDIETGGFSGTPVFLIGVVPLDTSPLVMHQWLARDYPEERAILAQLAKFAKRRDQWVTFNGKSFDVPFVRDRAVVNRVALDAPAAHVDLLHAARRRWRDETPDCRLQTLEREILGRVRVGDVPSSDVPELFHHFIRTGNIAPLRPVLEHNRIDLVSSAELLVRLSEPATR